jgi:hypothetical protein
MQKLLETWGGGGAYDTVKQWGVGGEQAVAFRNCSQHNFGRSGRYETLTDPFRNRTRLFNVSLASFITANKALRSSGLALSVTGR